MNTEKISLVGMTTDELEPLLQELNQPPFRANQLYQWIHHHNIETFQEMTNLSKGLRDRLADLYCLKTIKLQKLEVASDGTEKYLWQLPDHRFVESVLIPEENRNTICISSQVGCSLGCHFCATGTMGLIRNLTSGEIVEQVLKVKKISRHQITNVVFMGMGEPFLNYQRTIQACQILSNPQGTAMAGRKITISTSGIVPKIYQYADDNLPFGLAISLHAPNQTLREQLMPIAFKFSLTELIESIKYYMNVRKRNRVTFEYVLLHGINDSPSEAKQLISLLSPLRCKLNLIPCNKYQMGYEAPPPGAIDKFLSVLMDAPFAITVRRNRGEDIAAACGQLAVKIEEKSIHMKY